jgi:pectate lyase-like protein
MKTLFRILIAILVGASLAQAAPNDVIITQNNATTGTSQVQTLTPGTPGSMLGVSGLGKAQTVRASFNVMAYGATGLGVVDDSPAIIAAATAASAVNGSLYFPPGTYLYGGVALSQNNLTIVTDGPNTATVVLTNGDYFYKPTGMNALSVRYMGFLNGKGFLKMLGTGANVAGYYEISGCTFNGYTECAIGSLSSDMPYWKIDNNIFNGSTAWTSKGIALAGLADTSSITRNAFQRNLHAIELGGWGNAHISQNEFIHWNTHTGPTSAIWLVASSVLLTNLPSLSITDNKFGNENLNTNDFYILVAAQGTGGDFVTNAYATTDLGASLFYVAGAVTIHGNQINSVTSFANGFITSYTPFLRDFKLDNISNNLVPPITLNCTYVNDRLNQTNEIDLTSGIIDASEGLEYPLSAKPLGITKDPNGYAEGTTGFVHSWQGGSDTSYVPLVEPTNVSALGLSNVSISGINDAYGNTGGGTLTWSNISGYAGINFTPSVANKPVWLEVDLRSSASNPLPYVVLEVHDQATGLLIWFRRFINLTPQWRKYRFLWTPSSTAGAQFLFINEPYSAGVTNVDVGRIFVYQADQPVAHEQQYPIMLSLLEGITAPAAVSGRRTLYVDTADGFLKEVSSGNAVSALLINGVNQTQSDPTFFQAQLSGSAGHNREIYSETLGVNRWSFGANSTAESGANAGSDYEIHGYSDVGGDLGAYFTINRATGAVSVSNVGATSQNFTPQASALTETTNATIINWNISNTFTLTLNGNLNSVTLLNQQSGQTIVVAITNTVSNYTVTWGNSIKWTGGSQPVQTIGAHTDVWTIIDLGGTLYGSVVQNF